MAEGSAETILTWNTANWISVVLMVGIMYAIIAGLMKVYLNFRSA